MKKKIFPIILVMACTLAGCADSTQQSQKSAEASTKITEIETIEPQSTQTNEEQILDTITEKNQREKLLEQYTCIKAEQENYRGDELIQTNSVYIDEQKIISDDFWILDVESQELVAAPSMKQLYALGNLYWFDEDGGITKIDGDEDIERGRSSVEKVFGISECENRKVMKNEEVDGMLHIQISVPVEDYYEDKDGYDYQELRTMNVREIYWDYYVDKDTYLLQKSIRTMYNGPSGCVESITYTYEYGGECIELPEGLPQ